jgi:hypothetical protein
VLNNGNEIRANSWIGDFDGDWKEKALVDQFYLAAQRIDDDRNENANREKVLKLTDNKLAVVPLDMCYGIPKYAYSTEESAMFYIALRSEVSLNIMNSGKRVTTDYAEQIGMYDAYVYLKNCQNKFFMKNFCSIPNLSEKIYNSTVYCTEFKNTQPGFKYEFAQVHNSRHPVFIENDENGCVEYSYMTNKNDNEEFIPMDNFNTLVGNSPFSKQYNYNNGTDFKPKNKNSSTFLIATKGTQVSGAGYNDYTNTCHFEVFTDSTEIQRINDAHNDLDNGKLSVGNIKSTQYKSAVDKHILLDSNRGDKFRGEQSEDSHKSYSDLGIDISEFEELGEPSFDNVEAFNNIKSKLKNLNG